MRLLSYHRLFLLLFFGLTLPLLNATAQALRTADGLTYHPVRTIAPADPDLADLAFLKQEIGAARVVFLGEPTHGEGNVFEAKTRLVRFLRQQGFGTVAFESGFYEVARAQQDIEAGQNPATCLNKSLFPIWTHSREFQPLTALVGKGQLKVAGFDPQLSGEYGEEMMEDLQAFLGSKQSEAVPFDYLEEVIDAMGRYYTFPPTHQYALFNLAIGKATKQLRQVATAEPGRRSRAEFWLQTLASLNALARDYARNDPGAKGPEGFKASDSNVRDQLMADNLLWYLRQHPTEKVICWGATGHFAGPLKGLQNDELQDFRPMGSLVKAALPAGQVYLLGTATAGGIYGNVHGPRKPVPTPAPGSLEAQLDAVGPEYLFVPMRQPALANVTASLFEYQPLAGNWTQVLDGLLFLKTVRPPEYAEQDLPPTLRDSLRLAKTSSGTLAGDAQRRLTVRAAGSGPAAGQLRGVVLDEKTRAAVPFASVYLQRQGVGLTTNIKGEFELPRPAGPDSLVATCLGFGQQALAVGTQSYLTVLLPPQAYALAEVTVKGESLDPRKIMARVIKQLPQNYTQRDYNADVYARASSTNFDSLLYDVEYFSTFYDAQGYRSVGSGASRLEEVKWNKEPNRSGDWGDYHFAHSAYFANFVDLVDQNPIFQARTLKKYTYSLASVIQDQGRETLVIDFVAKKKNRRTTGDYFDQGYSGKLYINRADYAVTRCDVEWQRDTVLLNEMTRKYFARGGTVASRWHHLHDDYRIRQSMTYQQPQPGGPYFLDRSIQTWIERHRDLATGRRMEKLSVQSLQFANIRTTGVEVLPERPPAATMLLKGRPFHEEFWRTHQRPDGAAVTPQMKAPAR
ncbi:erythromycin esterase family protein [Hymenobacter sp. IS2118]|uniref:erythromycin esterase family protein n=1 Tax=Hymenobacter sp. IS2118 TaxID=1505605 RepID=UPI000553E33E|nr:erythromycin esterase family protein [Hymenobacter sp. IS2118]